MLVGIITEKTLKAVNNQILMSQTQVDIFEWRLDYLKELDLPAIAQCLNDCPIPMIFTLRSQDEGGCFVGSEQERLEVLQELLKCKPSYVDIEAHVDLAQLTISPEIEIIRSYHDFNNTPDDIAQLLTNMMDERVCLYKIATMANNCIDVLRMLQFVKTNSGRVPLVAHCMGECGRPSRVLGAVLGNFWTYGDLDQQAQTAPGLLAVSTLREIYNIYRLQKGFDIFALIGDPVEQSLGHVFHNKAFESANIPAVYVKICVHSDELITFLQMIKTLPFKGLSVTMPLKEIITPMVDEIDTRSQAIGAINTVKISKGRLCGSNTDGIGALLALKAVTTLHNRTVLILGAGGAAKSIAHAIAFEQPAKLVIANRTLARAQALSLDAMLLDDVSEVFDVVINTIPTNDKGEFHTATMRALEQSVDCKTVLMDINYAKGKSSYAQFVIQKKCTAVPGYNMFEQQAALQLDFWFIPDDSIDDSIAVVKAL